MARHRIEQPRRGCIWCGNRSGPFSDEHAIAQWISKEFHKRYGITLPIQTPNFSGPSQPVKGQFFDEDDPGADATNVVGMKVRVCKQCNGGWMSSMEQAVMSTLPALMFGDTIELDPAKQTSLAAWAAKTLINLGYEGHYRPDQLYPIALRDYVRTRGVPPDEVLIVAASMSGLERKMKSRVREMKLYDHGKLLGMMPLTTTLIDRVALQMLNPTVDWPTEHGAVSAGAAVQLWPLPGGSVSWPPASSIEASDYETFANPDDDDILR